MRGSRILVPWLAWLLALGQPKAIDGTYLLIIAASIFGGTYYLSRTMSSCGQPAAWGLLFLALPATLIGIDTLTVDVVLAAVCALFVWQIIDGQNCMRIWITLASAALIREIGFILVLGCVLAFLIRKKWWFLFFYASASLPALGWYRYLRIALPPPDPQLHDAVVPVWTRFRPQIGILMRMLDPLPYHQLSPAKETATHVMDFLSLAAILGLAILAVCWIRRTVPLELATLLTLSAFMVLGLVEIGFWTPIKGYGRAMAPLFLFTAIAAAQRKGARSLTAVALLFGLVDLRFGAEMSEQVMGILALVHAAL